MTCTLDWTRRLTLCVTLLAIAPLAAAQEAEPTPAEAPPAPSDNDAKARTIYQNGVDLYEQGRYEASVTAFREAMSLSGQKALLFNIANAYERTNDLQQAVDALVEYRIYAQPEEQEKLETRIRVLERRIDEVRMKAIADQVAATQAAAAAVAAAPVVIAPPTTRANGAKWAIFGVGGAIAAGSGTLAALSYVNTRTHKDAGDEAAYNASRTLNAAGLAGAGVGVALAAVSLALPSRSPVRAASLQTIPGGAVAHTSFRF